MHVWKCSSHATLNNTRNSLTVEQLFDTVIGKNFGFNYIHTEFPRSKFFVVLGRQRKFNLCSIIYCMCER